MQPLLFALEEQTSACDQDGSSHMHYQGYTLQTAATSNILLPVWTLVAHLQVIPKTITSGILKLCDYAGLATF